VKLDRLDWLLVTLAAVGIVVGFVINPPVCIPALGPGGPPGCVQWRFPFEITAGIVQATIALTIAVVRIRRRSP
jgi:hypothetical protein